MTNCWTVVQYWKEVDRHLVNAHLAEALNSLTSYSNKKNSTEKGEIDELDKVIEMHRSVLDLWSLGSVDQPHSLRRLAYSLVNRYKQQDTMSDLDEAIMICQTAYPLYPLGHSGRTDTFSQLATYLIERYIRLDIDSDLDKAITFHRLTADLRRTYFGRAVSPLADCLYERHRKKSTMSDLETAIELYRSAIEHFPLADTLCNLARCLERRYLKLRASMDLDEAIALRRSELDILPTDRFWSLYNLAGDLWHRYRRQHSMSDLHEAIVLYRRALKLPYLSCYCLGLTLEKIGDCLNAKSIDPASKNTNFNEVIGFHRLLLDLHPPGHLERSLFLHKLADCLLIKYKSHGTIYDLEEAITLKRTAIELYSLDHSYRTATCSLGDCLNERSKDHRFLVFEGHPDHAHSYNTPIIDKLTKGQGAISQSVHPTDTGSRFKSVINDTIQNIRKRFIRSARKVFH